MAVLALPGPVVLANGLQQCMETHVLCDDVLATFPGDENCVLRLGRIYRSRFPAEAHPDVLARSLQTAHTRGAGKFADVIAQDFETDNTVQLDGWVLSRTEARQAALYSILHS
jgi:hypothetical protein